MRLLKIPFPINEEIPRKILIDFTKLPILLADNNDVIGRIILKICHAKISAAKHVLSLLHLKRCNERKGGNHLRCNSVEQVRVNDCQFFSPMVGDLPLADSRLVSMTGSDNRCRFFPIFDYPFLTTIDCLSMIDYSSMIDLFLTMD